MTIFMLDKRENVILKLDSDKARFLMLQKPSLLQLNNSITATFKRAKLPLNLESHKISSFNSDNMLNFSKKLEELNKKISLELLSSSTKLSMPSKIVRT